MRRIRASYWQVTVFLPKAPLALGEVLGEGLITLGANAVEQLYQRRRFVGVRTYFPAKKRKEKLLKEIRRLLEPWSSTVRPRFKITWRKFQRQDWQERWKRFIKPLIFRGELAILPKHIKKHPAITKQMPVIRMDPGLAFGTGRHPTTYLCLQEILYRLHQAKVRSLLDLGTGSGILALAASLLKVPRVVAVDPDPIALDVARENFRQHQREIALFLGSIDRVQGKFQLIVANILLQPIMSLLPEIARHVTKRGEVILSGILISQLPELQKALKKGRWVMKRKRLWRGWACVVIWLP